MAKTANAKTKVNSKYGKEIYVVAKKGEPEPEVNQALNRIIERAKKLMAEIKGTTDSREISKEIKDSARTAAIQEYGKEKLPSGDLSGKEIIVVEGRADVLNLLKHGIN